MCFLFSAEKTDSVLSVKEGLCKSPAQSPEQRRFPYIQRLDFFSGMEFRDFHGLDFTLKRKETPLRCQ